VPVEQLVQAPAPAAAYWPARQEPQLVWPVELWNLPKAHAAHVAAPADGATWPATQSTQLACPELIWAWPVGHAVHADALAAAKVPARQGWQRFAPVVAA